MLSLNKQLNQDRRRHLRKVPEDFTFIQIERDEVGKVLNVSEGGLKFCSVTPVPRNLPLYFWFSFNLKDRIEAMREVAWTDSSSKIGGLRFIQLPPKSREQIQKWLSRHRPEEVPDAEPVGQPQLVAVGRRVEIGAREPDRVAKFVSKAHAYRPVSPFGRGDARDSTVAPPRPLEIEPPKARVDHSILSLEGVDPVLSKAAPFPASGFESLKPPAFQPVLSLEGNSLQGGYSGVLKLSTLPMRGIESLAAGLVPLQRHLLAKKRQLILGVLLGVLVSAFVTASMLKYRSYRSSLENKKATVAESPILKNDASAQPTTPALESKSSYPVAGIFFDPPARGRGTTPSRPTVRTKVTNAYLPARQQIMASQAPKQSPAPIRAEANTPLTANKKSPMTPNQLWNAVQAGNSKAAVELAELYIKGDGVPQNCQQARVLLLAASEKRNTAAIKRLQELDKDSATCP